MKFARSGPMTLILAAVLVIGAVTGIALLQTSKLLASAHDGDYALMRQVLGDLMSDAQDEVLSRAEAVAAMPEVRAALAARDRPKLLAISKRMWEVQAQKYDLDQAQFHVPPGISFLRLHKPESFGDDQTTTRPMLADVHHQKVVKKGVALSRPGPAVFGIVPIIDDGGNLIGSFEMGLDLGPEFDKVKQSFGLEAAIFFEERLVREISTEAPPEIMQPKNRVGKYIRFHATNPELAAALVTDKDIDVTEPKTYEREVAKTAWGVQLVPLYDYANHQIGVVALASDFGEDKRLARRALVWQLLTALFAMVLLTGVIFVVVRGMVLAPLASLNERMTALLAGEPAKPADPLDTYCEEMRGLAENYERLRAEREKKS